MLNINCDNYEDRINKVHNIFKNYAECNKKRLKRKTQRQSL